MLLLFFLANMFSLVTNAQVPATSIKLGVFPTIPKALEEEYCVGLFTYDSLPMAKKTYVFVTNIEKFALIKINGANVRLTLAQHSEPSKSSFKRVF